MIKRIIPCLDINNGRVVKGINFVNLVDAGDPAEQANNAMLCVKAFLEELGARMEDICKVTTYVTDPSYRDLVYPVLSNHLGDVSPCSTGIVVKALALPHIDFEIDVYAVIPENRA